MAGRPRRGEKKERRKTHWKAYGTKHPEKYQIKEISCVSNKFHHTKKIKVKIKK
ncbi:MAG: hypothetical protein U9O94_02785 [Nanoarchaeota archaeon]|nr:hypothetical protein [Nanoarchaeota archaeon]